MGRSERLVSHHRAAQLLGISRRWMSHLVYMHVLIPAVDNGTAISSLYSRDEVLAHKENRARGYPRSAAATAELALATCRAMKDRFEALCKTLGLDGRVLSFEEEDVYQLHVKVQKDLHPKRITFHSKDILDWASIFQAMDETYLRRVAQLAGTDSPWAYYLQLATKLAAISAVVETSNMAFAHACMESARKNLRNVAYFYVHSTVGANIANRTFMDGELVDDVIAHLFPRAFSI